jgi:hypothetical protein
MLLRPHFSSLQAENDLAWQRGLRQPSPQLALTATRAIPPEDVLVAAACAKPGSWGLAAPVRLFAVQNASARSECLQERLWERWEREGCPRLALFACSTLGCGLKHHVVRGCSMLSRGLAFYY